MKLNQLVLLTFMPLTCAVATAAPNFGGVYSCTGTDHSEGKYTGTVALERVPAQGSGSHGSEHGVQR